MNASEAQKFKPLRLRKAFDYAAKISEWIAPYCLQIEPVGEIRRHCSICHEIELLTVPRFRDGKHLLFEFLDEYVQESLGRHGGNILQEHSDYLEANHHSKRSMLGCSCRVAP